MRVPRFILLGLVPIVLAGMVQGQGGSQATELPGIVVRGLGAYRDRGARAALEIWLRNSPAAGDSRVIRSTAEALDQVSAKLGSFQGHDVLRVSRLGPHVSRSYLILLFERGPVYAYFDCYLTAEGWIISSFQYNGKPELVLPELFLAR